MSGLPSGWTLAALSDLCKQPEQRVPHADEMFTYIDIASVDRDLKTVSEPQQLLGADAPSRARKLVENGDVIVSMTRPNLNAVALIGEQHNGCIASTGFDVLKPIEVEPRWIFSAVRSARFVDAMCEKVQGALYPAVKSADIREFEIPLPPLAEQTRIAKKLDELLAQVDTLKARIDAIPALLKRFRQSVLAAAVSGRLTEEWRKTLTPADTGADVIRNDHIAKLALLEQQPELKKKKSSLQSDIDESYLFEIPESWTFTTWGKISEWITYGFTRPMPKSESGQKLLTAKDVQRFELELVDCGLTTTEAFQALSDKDKPIKGDLLITKDGSIGRAALVCTDEAFCINQSVAVCWLRSTTMHKRYLELLSNGDFTQRFVKDKAQGMAIQHLSIIDFAKCPVPVPSYKEQNEIVRQVEQLFAFADQLETKVASAKRRIDLLTQSILAKAFRGELVPQDPNDEPASVLLDRIKTQRAAAPKAKRGKKATG